MNIKTVAGSALCALLLGTGGIAAAQAPAQGVVYEGVSAPGVVLGQTRVGVTASYGAPNYCQSVEVSGDMASCAYPVDGGGQVSIRYRGADGGNASASDGDVAHSIQWYSGVQWVTSQGVDAQLALDFPQAAIAAYPDAQVTNHALTGEVYRISDAAQGIDIVRAFDVYSGRTTVHMTIFPPIVDAPVTLLVPEIALSASGKGYRGRVVSGAVQVQDTLGQAAAGASVSASWNFPDGTSREVQAITQADGAAHFSLDGGLRRGLYTLEVSSIELEGAVLDAEASQLLATIRVR